MQLVMYAKVKLEAQGIRGPYVLHAAYGAPHRGGACAPTGLSRIYCCVIESLVDGRCQIAHLRAFSLRVAGHANGPHNAVNDG